MTYSPSLATNQIQQQYHDHATTHQSTMHHPFLRYTISSYLLLFNSRALCICVAFSRVYHPLLHCTALRCSVVSCTALRYTALSYSALHLSSLHFTALYCTALHSTALHCTALHFPSPHCTTPHYTTLNLLGVFVRQSQTLHRNNPSPPQRSGSNTLN